MVPMNQVYHSQIRAFDSIPQNPVALYEVYAPTGETAILKNVDRKSIDLTSLRLSQLCPILAEAGFEATLVGADCTVHSVNTLESAGPGELAFLSNRKYAGMVAQTRASAVILDPTTSVPGRLSALRCADPYGAVTAAIIAIHGHRRHPQWGISKTAQIDASAKIGKNANIGPCVVIAAQSVIGDNCTIYPGCYIADGATLGSDCTLYPNVVVYDFCNLGDRVTVHAGSVIGEDGLGYAPVGEHWVKIPQVGRAVIGNDVEIGANCAIDRATLGTTEIGAGTKFGNVIVVGHGTKIGPNCMFVGLVGIAGSVTVGRHVTLAGQVGVAGHLAIGDNAMAAAQSGIAGDIDAETKVLGSPAIPIDVAKRSAYVFQRLPDWVRRIKVLENEVEGLKEAFRLNLKNQV